MLQTLITPITVLNLIITRTNLSLLLIVPPHSKANRLKRLKKPK